MAPVLFFIRPDLELALVIILGMSSAFGGIVGDQKHAFALMGVANSKYPIQIQSGRFFAGPWPNFIPPLTVQMEQTRTTGATVSLNLVRASFISLISSFIFALIPPYQTKPGLDHVLPSRPRLDYFRDSC